MKGRTARLSIGAAGLVVLWIVTYWWMDPAPTIRFDGGATSGRDRSASHVSTSGRSVEVQSTPVSDDADTTAGVQPATAVLQQTTVAPPEVENDQIPQQPIAAPTRLYTIRPGDLLSRIAQREYGSIRYTTFLYEHNRERLGLSSPDAIREGQVLEIPPLNDTTAAGGG